MLPRIEVKGGGFYLVVRGAREPEDWFRVYACTWDQVRRRFVPARRKLPTHVIFVSRHRWKRSAMLEWQHVLGREYTFLDDPRQLADLFRRARGMSRGTPDRATRRRR
jgi:hypothetical protein